MYRPLLSNASVPLVTEVEVIDEAGRTKRIHIPGERALTIFLNKQELVTLMTLGGEPEALVLGWLRNQRLIKSLEDVISVQVDWDVEAVAVTATPEALAAWNESQKQRTVTTGCGQGSMFGDVLSDLDSLQLDPHARLRQDTLVEVVGAIRTQPSVYKQAGSVHGCGLFRGSELLIFVEDVGRHNAVDAIAGWMWLNNTSLDGLVFYTTGRLTSEMVVKGAQMGIPFLLSRSGVTNMGLEMAKRVGLTLVGRCSGQHFLVYHGAQRIVRNSDSSNPAVIDAMGEVH